MKSLMAAASVGVLAIGLSPTGAAAAPPPDEVMPAARMLDDTQTITLITGDRVTVTGGGSLLIRRGEGREHITFLTQRLGEQRYVIPSDALPLVASGELDRRLFDVTYLRRIGYHDQGRADLPVILAGNPVAGDAMVRELPAVDAAAVRIDKSAAGAFWREATEAGAVTTMAAGLDAIWLDGLRQPLLDESVPQVGAPAAWAVGLDGTGSTVAVLDTGIDATHPDLADRVVGQRNFVADLEDDRDLVGHGTHVASTVAGTGAGSGGRYTGVAPGTQLLDGKVCAAFGCPESSILAGMQWAAEQGADVVNMSLGGPPLPDDPLVAAVEQLTDEYGTLFVIAAGNDGSAASVSSPAVADSALAVGAVDKDDALAGFSSRGPAPDGSLKPDLTAPGVEIVAANSVDGFLGVPGEPYTTLSGTSMATPHAAGAAAILAQQHPDWSPGQLKAALLASASASPDLVPYDQGSGRLDVARAIGQSVTAIPASVSFDRPHWPHADDDPQTRTVSYHNDSADVATLDLTLTTAGPDGAPAPDGFFTLSQTSVAVPAGGSSEVSITVDTSVGDVDGFFGGYLTATGPGGVVVTTAFAVDREVESYDYTLVHTDREGTPTSAYSTLLMGGDPVRFIVVAGEPETTVRLPIGDYFLGSFVSQPVADDEFVDTLLVQPRLVVSRGAGDQTIAIDARQGRAVSVDVPDPEAVPTHAYVDGFFLGDEIGLGFGILTDGGDMFAAQLGPDQPVEGMYTSVGGGFAVPAADGSLEASTEVYNVAWGVDGSFVTGFERRARSRDLARVRADHAAQVDGSEAIKYGLSVIPEVGAASGLGIPMSLPHTRTEYYNTDGGRHWLNLFDEVIESEEGAEIVILLDGEPIAYRARRTYVERWNYAAIGPSVAAEFVGVLRFGNELFVQPALYGDGAGHVGFAPSATKITVLRDGEVIAESSDGVASIEVPPEPADYRVEAVAERTGSAPLSRRVSLAWEFESGFVDGETTVRLPVSVVRFSPPVRPDNTAPDGRTVLVPVSVDPAEGSGAGPAERLAVEVSFDDGETWQPAPVLGGRYVWLRHPRGDGFVSLRATATDTAGNAVEQTIIRAYEIA